jgi:predicted RNA-binding Zn-ribbon protein involved in translation (DUF1610 family)
MIKCENCKVEINSSFSYSISSNSCPACGQEIMDHEKSRMLGYIMNTMSEQPFSSKIEKGVLNEISTFIFSEFLDVDEDEPENEIGEVFESQDEDPAEDQQFDDQSSSLVPEVPNDEDLDEKATRLIQKYRADQRVLSSGRKTGVAVRRVST